MSDSHIDFFKDQTDDGVSNPVRVHILDWGLFAWGEFDGATVQLEISPSELDADDHENMKWFVHPNGVFTEEDYRNGDLCECWFRARVLNAGENTSLNFSARPRVEKAI